MSCLKKSQEKVQVPSLLHLAEVVVLTATARSAPSQIIGLCGSGSRLGPTPGVYTLLATASRSMQYIEASEHETPSSGSGKLGLWPLRARNWVAEVAVVAAHSTTGVSIMLMIMHDSCRSYYCTRLAAHRQGSLGTSSCLSSGKRHDNGDSVGQQCLTSELPRLQ